jgi:hypothetical protein
LLLHPAHLTFGRNQLVTTATPAVGARIDLVAPSGVELVETRRPVLEPVETGG